MRTFSGLVLDSRNEILAVYYFTFVQELNCQEDLRSIEPRPKSTKILRFLSKPLMPFDQPIQLPSGTIFQHIVESPLMLERGVHIDDERVTALDLH